MFNMHLQLSSGDISLLFVSGLLILYIGQYIYNYVKNICHCVINEYNNIKNEFHKLTNTMTSINENIEIFVDHNINNSDNSNNLNNLNYSNSFESFYKIINVIILYMLNLDNHINNFFISHISFQI